MTILIVDDEKYVRDEIRKILEPLTDKFEMTILAAEDGTEGLEKALLMPPHLLITDVQMPHMNGLELAAQIQQFVPDCRTIFLSNYSDKDYLRSAIHLHALEYIDKPVDSGRLLELVESLMEQLNNNIQKLRFHEEQISENVRNAKMLLTQLCSQMIRNKNANLELIRPLCSQYNMEVLFQCAYRCLLFRVSKNQHSEFIFPELEGVQMFPCDYSERGMMILMLYSKDANALNDGCISVFWNKVQYITDITGLAVSPIADDYKEVPIAYQLAQAAFSRLFFSAKSQIIFQQKKAIPRTEPLDEEELKRIISTMDNHEASTRELNALFTFLQTQTNVPVNDIRNYFCLAADYILQYSSKNMLDFHEKYTNNNLYQTVWEAANLDELKKIIFGWKDELTTQNKGEERTIRVTIAYIQKHYSDSGLNLDSLCHFTGYSKSYLCTVFKRMTGISINTYINKCRIDTACHLLMTTDKTLEQIADEVGFANQRYFCQVFKTYMKQTPKKFRKSGGD